MPGSSHELRRSRKLTSKEAGNRGEELARRYLIQHGYSVVRRNYRTRYGEIDLISRHGGTLVFVEVKLRRGTGYGDPLEAVTEHKQAAIRAIAEQYLAEEQPEFEEARFDVIGILVKGGSYRIEHVEDAF